MEWQPIETAPIWEAVIVFDPGASRTKSCESVFTAVQTSKGVWELSQKIVKSPTHWMHLPEPPND